MPLPQSTNLRRRNDTGAATVICAMIQIAGLQIDAIITTGVVTIDEMTCVANMPNAHEYSISVPAGTSV